MPREDDHRVRLHLDRLLAERGMTLAELAHRVGITTVNLSILKNERAKAIRFSTLTRICHAPWMSRAWITLFARPVKELATEPACAWFHRPWHSWRNAGSRVNSSSRAAAVSSSDSRASGLPRKRSRTRPTRVASAVPVDSPAPVAMPVATAPAMARVTGSMWSP